MFCPGCKQDVVEEKFYDWTTLAWGCCLGTGAIITLWCFANPGAGVMIATVAIAYAGIVALVSGPISCTACRTRLVNPSGRDKPPAHVTKNSLRIRACPFCAHENVLAANYCARCGHQLRLREEVGEEARVVFAEIEGYLETAKTWGREWGEGGRPQGARMAVVARIEQCEKRLARIRDDAKCPRKERVESRTLLSECVNMRGIFESKAFGELR